MLIRNLVIVVFFIFLNSCNDYINPNNGIRKDGLHKNKNSLSSDTLEDIVIKDKNKVVSNFDFLGISKKNREANIGFLQGVAKSDSSGPYIIKDIITDTLSFRLLFYPKNDDKSLVNFSNFKRAEDNNYQDYICFAFVYVMVDPYKMKDYHADNVRYPIIVKSFVRKKNDWDFVNSSKIQNQSELSKFEIKSIYETISLIR